jgi:hypothetical protein
MEDLPLGFGRHIAIEAFYEQDEGLGYPVAVAHALRDGRVEQLRLPIQVACFAKRPRVATFRRDDPAKQVRARRRVQGSVAMATNASHPRRKRQRLSATHHVAGSATPPSSSNRCKQHLDCRSAARDRSHR